jgi:hypothetical protein
MISGCGATTQLWSVIIIIKFAINHVEHWKNREKMQQHTTTNQDHHHTLNSINAEIHRLIAERDQMIAERAAENSVEMNRRGTMVADILYKASTMQDPSMALLYARAFVLPWRHYVLKTHFPNFIHALPSDLPPTWTRADAARFLLSVSRALERDRVGVGV